MNAEAARSELSRARVARAPRCCAFHAAWDAWLGRPPIVVRGWQLQADPARRWLNVAVCGVWHTAGSDLSLGRRLLRLARFELGALVLGQRWRDRRLDERRRVCRSRGADPELIRWERAEDELRRFYFDPWLDPEPDRELEWH